MFCRKVVLRNFTKFTGTYLRQSLFFNKVAGLRPTTLLKKRLLHRCLPVNFNNFLRTARGDCFSRLTTVPLTDSYHQFYSWLVNIMLWKFDTSWKVYTNADLKISSNVRVPMKIIPWNLAFLIAGILELFTRKVCSIFVYEHI